MNTAYTDVLAFHEKFGCDIGTHPAVPAVHVGMLRMKLLREEYGELAQAWVTGDLVGIADGLADLIYVAIGFAIAYGIDLREVWDEVHASNMAKEGGATRADGKIMKPEGWTPPDIAGIIARQIERGRQAATTT